MILVLHGFGCRVVSAMASALMGKDTMTTHSPSISSGLILMEKRSRTGCPCISVME